MIYIIYPERRNVSFQTINSWYSDAVANGQISEEYLNVPDDNPQEQARALSDAGLITVAAYKFG